MTMVNGNDRHRAAIRLSAVLMHGCIVTNLRIWRRAYERQTASLSDAKAGVSWMRVAHRDMSAFAITASGRQGDALSRSINRRGNYVGLPPIFLDVLKR